MPAASARPPGLHPPGDRAADPRAGHQQSGPAAGCPAGGPPPGPGAPPPPRVKRLRRLPGVPGPAGSGVPGAPTASVSAGAAQPVPGTSGAGRAVPAPGPGQPGRRLPRASQPCRPALRTRGRTSPPGSGSRRNLRQSTNQSLLVLSVKYMAGRCDQEDVPAGNDDLNLPLVTCSQDHKFVPSWTSRSSPVIRSRRRRRDSTSRVAPTSSTWSSGRSGQDVGGLHRGQRRHPDRVHPGLRGGQRAADP